MAWRGPRHGQLELHSYFEILKGTNGVPSVAYMGCQGSLGKIMIVTNLQK